MANRYRIGDKVIYTREKYTTRPGPRAKNIVASPHGESYQYQVDKYWIVSDVRSDQSVVLSTRRGKSHVAQADDPRLRRATWLERIFKATYFPSLSQPPHQFSTPTT